MIGVVYDLKECQSVRRMCYGARLVQDRPVKDSYDSETGVLHLVYNCGGFLYGPLLADLIQKRYTLHCSTGFDKGAYFVDVY